MGIKQIILFVYFIITMNLSAAEIANYHMDECSWDGTAGEVKDSVGTYDAKVDIDNTTTTTPYGQINRAGRFNEDGTVRSAVALPPSVLDSRDAFTFTTWIYLTDADTNAKNTFLSAENGESTDDDDLLFYVNSGTISLKYDGSNFDFSDLDSSKLFGGQWTFIALSKKKNNNRICIVINRGEDGSERQCNNYSNDAAQLNIEYLLLAQDRAGNEPSHYYPGGELQGSMDEVKFYDVFLNKTKLQKIYDEEVEKLYPDGSTPPTVECSPSVPLLVNYLMDECYFLGSVNGVSGDILDSSGNEYHATSVDRIDSEGTDAKICRSGAFGNNSYAVPDTEFTLGADWSLSVWLNFPFVQDGKQYYILGSYPGKGDLPVFQYKNNTTLEWGIYDNNGGLSWNAIDNTLTGWHHLVFANIGNSTKLYVDGEEINSIARGTSGDVGYLWTSSDDLGGQSIASNIDEMKFFSDDLSLSEVQIIYANESAGFNYDSTLRDCPSCSSAPIAANSWELIGIPADLRTGPNTVGDIFADMNGTFNTDWSVYKRIYSDTNNSSGYEKLQNLTDALEFGQGYWLGSELDSRWSVNGADPVDYDGSDCPTAAPCVEITLKATNKNFGDPDLDPNDGTGPYRNFMTGFIGMDKPVDWADCRIVIDGTQYTPSDANASGYASKQIWLYNPNATGANPNGYTTCDDITPGGCKLVPFKGFWVQLHGKTKGKSVKLLVPKE